MGWGTKLDEFVPDWQFNEVHRTRVAAPPGRIFAAVKAVTADDILFFRTLVWLRRFGRPGPEGILNPSERTPILDVATRTTFLLLAADPPRELVVGTLVIAPGGPQRPVSADWFRTLSAPGFAKAAMNFVVTPDDAGGARLTTETRVAATDSGSRRRFATYRRVIYPGSALIRRMWLRAIRKRAESPAEAAATPETATRIHSRDAASPPSRGQPRA